MKTAVLLATCMALFFVSATATAFSTCPMNMDRMPAEMQMDSEMPCHNTEDSQDQDSQPCEGCDCQHCVQINALSIKELKIYYEKGPFVIAAGKPLFSHQIETLFQPPRHFS